MIFSIDILNETVRRRLTVKARLREHVVSDRQTRRQPSLPDHYHGLLRITQLRYSPTLTTTLTQAGRGEGAIICKPVMQLRNTQ